VIRLTPYVFASAVGAAAVLIATFTGNAWAAVAPSTLFAFVVFPRWRGKLYRLVDKLIDRFGHDRCTPP
jgi:hypothetical protein